MILIDNILVNEDILNTGFACDLKKCKGACCTFKGEFGAPVLDSEIEIIQECVVAASEYLSKRSKDIINKIGFVEGKPGDYSTVCIEQKDCVFVYFEGKIAKCALEKAYFNGKTKFRKPISCHLFPIRVNSFGKGFLYYAKFSECDTALENGDNLGIKMYEFVKDSLIRAYGEEWYEMLDQYVKSKL